MPLPLVYGIEYQNILHFLREEYSEDELNKKFDFSQKSRVCPFKDPQSFKCRIYPVRPFTCRVYGRKVPPIFFGIGVAPETADAVYCQDMTVSDSLKESEFNKNYPSFWEKLTSLSLHHSPFSEPQKKILKELSDLPDLVLLAFGEFKFLTKQSISWYREGFKRYWDKMGNLL